MKRVTEQSLRTGEMVRRLRALAQRTEPKQELADLNQTIRAVVALADPDVKYNRIQLTLALDESMPPVLIDAIQIQQVVLNLLRNEIGAMQGIPKERRRIRVTTSVNGQHVDVAVCDMEHGIDDEELDCVFSAFYLDEGDRDGAGHQPLNHGIAPQQPMGREERRLRHDLPF